MKTDLWGSARVSIPNSPITRRSWSFSGSVMNEPSANYRWGKADSRFSIHVYLIGYAFCCVVVLKFRNNNNSFIGLEFTSGKSQTLARVWLPRKLTVTSFYAYVIKKGKVHWQGCKTSEDCRLSFVVRGNGTIWGSKVPLNVCHCSLRRLLILLKEFPFPFGKIY